MATRRRKHKAAYLLHEALNGKHAARAQPKVVFHEHVVAPKRGRRANEMDHISTLLLHLLRPNPTRSQLQHDNHPEKYVVPVVTAHSLSGFDAWWAWEGWGSP